MSRIRSITRPLLVVLPLVVLSLSTACKGDDSIVAPKQPVASNPAPAQNNAVSPFAVSAPYSSGDRRIIDDNGSPVSGSYVYFALPAGAYPNAVRATVQLANGTSVVAAAVDGAIDPIAISAGASDALTATLYLDTGESLEFNITVPMSSQPQVVRLSPPANTDGVSLTATMRIVFSEPIAEASVNNSAVQLMNGETAEATAVDGQISFGDDAHFTLVFTPTVQLSPATTYVLRVDPGLRGDNGQSIASGMTSEFRTTDLTQVNEPTTLKAVAAHAAAKNRTLRSGRGR